LDFVAPILASSVHDNRREKNGGKHPAPQPRPFYPCREPGKQTGRPQKPAKTDRSPEKQENNAQHGNERAVANSHVFPRSSRINGWNHSFRNLFKSKRPDFPPSSGGQGFEEGDEALLRPMILKDIAEKTGLDLSTISRVSNSKYAQTRWGTFPLRHFFSDSYVTAEGDELSTREIKATLRDLVDAEDKQKPLSDEALGKLLAEKGYPIARRTVAKYREQLGIPIARLRK
jgi:hypothetical protein